MDLQEILREIDKTVSLEADTNRKIASLRADIQSIEDKLFELREQFSELNNERHRLQRKRMQLRKAKDSVERKELLRQQQEKIAAETEELRRRAKDLLSGVPWGPDGSGVGPNKDKIFDWQLEGAIQLASAKRGLLADERGMGKTLSALAFTKLVEARKILFLTRKQYAAPLYKEFEIWRPGIEILPVVGMAHGTRAILFDILKDKSNFMVVANFEMWRKNPDIAKEFVELGFDTVILDEGHQLKTFNSRTTTGFREIAYSTENLLIMTGSPVQNRPQELFSILHCLYPKLFPSEKMFIRDYCFQIAQNKWVWRTGGLNSLVNLMSNFFVARKRADVGNLVPPPKITEYVLTFDGYEEQKEFYTEVARGVLTQLLEDREIPIISQIAALTRLAQATVWPPSIKLKIGDTEVRPKLNQSVKIDWAEDLIKELVDEEQRVVLFSRFVEPIRELQRRLTEQGISTALVTGETDKKANAEAISDFDLKTAPTVPKYSVLLATYQTIGEAVNLNAARHLIQLDRFWKPSADDQAIGRVDRINSTDQANVYRAVVEDSLDGWMNSLIEQKRAMLSQFASAKESKELRNDFMDHLKQYLN